MTVENIRFVHELMESAGFTRLLDELVDQETNARLPALRSGARDGDPVAAALIEGEIRALELLPSIFKSYAKKANL